MATRDARPWGPRLRFSTPARLIDEFRREHERELPPFILYGSGDFHHLTAIWAKKATAANVLISFDNHPDWDIRPPKWCCGSWINRALELAHVQYVSVWGCGNFECWWPGKIFGNRRAERSGSLAVHPWSDDRPAKDQQRPGAIRKENWRDHFERFAQELETRNVYVTIDLDCLHSDEAITNWESGRFTVADVVWALEQLRRYTQIVAGDICGAYSEPQYARWKQRFASEMDHPKLKRPRREQIRSINRSTLQKLWPALIGAV